MSTINPQTIDLFKEFLNNKTDRWQLANGILYRMCEEHPLHVDENEIVAKLWIIGRTYAAALERRKNKKDDKIDFYYEEAAPAIKEFQKYLDNSIEEINKGSNITIVIKTHKLLVDNFKKITGLEKRSLASKYLHFHCRNAVYIYDSIASTSMNKLVKNPEKDFLDGMDEKNFDKTYADFVAKMLVLKAHLENSLNINLSPRDLDDFLLSNTMTSFKHAKEQK